jgi:hypothetical protein
MMPEVDGFAVLDSCAANLKRRISLDRYHCSELTVDEKSRLQVKSNPHAKGDF